MGQGRGLRAQAGRGRRSAQERGPETSSLPPLSTGCPEGAGIPGAEGFKNGREEASVTVGALGNIPAKWQPLLAHLPVVYPGYDYSPASWVSVSSFVKWGLHQLIQRALFNFTVLVPGMVGVGTYCLWGLPSLSLWKLRSSEPPKPPPQCEWVPKPMP